MTAFTRIARAVLAAMILMLGGAVPALSETAGAVPANLQWNVRRRNVRRIPPR